MNEVRVINFVPGLGSGGIAALMKEWYKRRAGNIVFDIATIGKGIAYDDLLSQGCRIYEFEPIKKTGVIRYIKNAYRIIKDGKYTAVHSHVGMNSFFIFIAAILAKVKVRILHAHGTKYNQDNGRFFNKIITSFFKKMSTLLANWYLACSNDAAVYLFGKRIAKKKSIIIRNGIDLNRFSCQTKTEKESKIIGYVARMEKSKNHTFLISVLKKMAEDGKKAELLLIGDGDTSEIKETAVSEGVDQYVTFLPAQRNIEDFYHKMDAFAFPSLNEGLGIVAIESQACGIPTIVSPGVPDDVIVSPLAKKLELDVDKWAAEFEQILERPVTMDVHDDIIRAGFDIDSSVNVLMAVYLGAENK